MAGHCKVRPNKWQNSGILLKEPGHTPTTVSSSFFRKMNPQQPSTNTHARATEDVAGPTNAHRVSSSSVAALRDISAAERRSATSPPSNNFLASSATDMAPAVPGMPSAEKLNTAPIIRVPSLGSKEEIISSSISASNESYSARSGNGAFSLTPSIISKASTLSTKKGQFSIEATETMRPDDMNSSTNENDLKHEAYSPSSSSSTNDIYEIDESSQVPAYITYFTASLQSTETIFTPRRKELHFFSDMFRQEYRSWLLEDEFDSDDEDSNDDHHHQDDYMYHQRCFTEYTGRTNFVQRNGGYRKSHEIGPLSFAETLDFDDAT